MFFCRKVHNKNARLKRRAASCLQIIERIESRLVLDRSITIVTHGFQTFGDLPILGGFPEEWVGALVRSIQNDSTIQNGPSRETSYEAVPTGATFPQWRGNHAFLALDWAGESNSGTLPLISATSHDRAVEKAGNTIYQLLRQEILTSADITTLSGQRVDLHVIGHSFGTLVNEIALRRLRNDAAVFSRVDFVMVTTLDPVGLVDSFQDQGLIDDMTSGRFADAVQNYYQSGPIITVPLLFIGDHGGVINQIAGTLPNAFAVLTGQPGSADDGDLIHPVRVVRDAAGVNGSGKGELTEQELGRYESNNPFDYCNAHCAVHDYYTASHDWRDFWSRRDPSSLSGPPISLDGQGGGHGIGQFDPSSSMREYAITAARPGNMVVEVDGINGSTDVFVELVDHEESVVDSAGVGSGAGRSARVVARSVRTGDRFTLRVFNAGATGSSYIVNVTQPDAVLDDPADEPLPARPAVADDYPDRYADAVRLEVSNQGSATRRGILDPGSHPDSGDGKDHDWFLVTARHDGPMRIAVMDRNVNIRVHGPDSTTLKVDSNPDPGVALLDVRAGQTFRIDVGPNDPGTTGRYTLQISQPASDLLPPIPSVCDNDVPWLAGIEKVHIPLSSGNGHSVGSIDDPGDVRWFQIDGANEGNMEVTVAPVNDDLKPFVTAFRANGGGIDTDTGEFDGEARVGFRVAAGERIIVAVSSHEGRYSGSFTINVSPPNHLPDDDVHDFGDSPRDLGPQITQEGDGSFTGKIESADDNDWFQIPIRGSGFLSIEVSANNSTVLPFLELSRDGTIGGFFETDDGRDGRAKITFLPEPGQSSLWAKVSSLDGTTGNYPSVGALE